MTQSGAGPHADPQVADIRINELRVSAIYTETCLPLIASDQPVDAPMKHLGRESTYNPEFTAALARDAGAPGFKPPWVPTGKSFWDKYLEQGLAGFNAGRAFKELVPLRQSIPRTVRPGWAPGNISLAGFYYPFGFAVAITATSSESLGLDSAVARAFQIRSDPLEVLVNGASVSMSMDGLGRECLHLLREQILGPRAAASQSTSEPFTVVTVVRGTGVDPGSPLDPNGRVFRALQALSVWSATWQWDNLDKLEDARIRIKTAPPSHIMFGRRRGRVVWFPAQFMPQPKRRYSMAVLHSNLVFATLHTESLGRFAAETNAQRVHGPLVGTHLEAARRAMSILSRLWAGKGNIYRTWSVRAQLEQNDLAAEVSALRKYFDLPGLQ